jgi:hypothetical protein
VTIKLDTDIKEKTLISSIFQNLLKDNNIYSKSSFGPLSKVALKMK